MFGKIILVIIVVITVAFGCGCSKSDGNSESSTKTGNSVGQLKERSLLAYYHILNKLINTKDKEGNISDSLMTAGFPVSGEEYIMFKGYTILPDEKPLPSLKLESLEETMVSQLVHGSDLYVIRYLEMSRFVDGEHADYYFNRLTGFAINFPDKFCFLRSIANPEYVLRIITIYDEVSKSYINPCE